ncbi:hypothetical protein FRB90_010006 [Tulasnella sp. 427]|nr:hypothetical protein FRB90_010006 [Tulasnella sp. 427]
MDSDEELGGSRPNPNPIAGSPTGKRKAQNDIAPPPKRISLGGSDAEGFTTREAQTSFDDANLGGEEAAPTPKPDKPKKKRKSKVDKALSKPDEGLQQMVPTEGDLPSAPAPPITADDTMTVEEAIQPPKSMKESVKKSKPKSRPSPQAASAPLPSPPQPSEPRANEPIVDEASEPPLGNVGSTATPAKGSPAPMNDRQSTPMSSSSKGPRGSIPYWRRPNKPLAELLNQATPGSSARASGLHKSIRIAPLHMNRKPPPPPLPPIPKKKPAKKGDGDESDEDDETPKVRLKRLAVEYESLEGLESKKANDRRKEIVEEIARLTN